jgi:hypothetical protein
MSASIAKRLGIFSFAVLYSGYVLCWDDAGLEAKNRLGQSIYVGPLMSEEDKIAITEPSSGKVNREYLLADECPSWKRKTGDLQREFTCLQSGKSPLAGATCQFRVLAKKNECGDKMRAYICVAGCQPKRVPLQIVLTPWEC